MFMVCALALVLHTDKGVGQGGSVLEKFSKPAPVKPAAPKTLTPQPGAPQPGASQPAPKHYSGSDDAAVDSTAYPTEAVSFRYCRAGVAAVLRPY